MSTEQNKALVRQFVAAADRQDFAHATSCRSPALVVHLAGAPGPLDLATFFQFGQMWRTAVAEAGYPAVLGCSRFNPSISRSTPFGPLRLD